MKLLTKLAISMVAVASMAQADVTLVGVDGGVTVLGLRVGGYAGLTVGTRPVGTYANAGYGTSCGTTVTTTTVAHNPCAYVCGPCEVVVPAPACPAPKPACPAPCDPCDPCAK